MSRQSYAALIEVIIDLLEQKAGCKQPAHYNVEGLDLCWSNNEENETVQKIISRLEQTLEQIADRNQEKHRELVQLLTRRFNIECALARTPVGAGGHLHQRKLRHELQEVAKRIEEIIDAENEDDHNGGKEAA